MEKKGQKRIEFEMDLSGGGGGGGAPPGEQRNFLPIKPLKGGGRKLIVAKSD